jgi:hypothetical protein
MKKSSKNRKEEICGFQLSKNRKSLQKQVGIKSPFLVC